MAPTSSHGGAPRQCPLTDQEALPPRWRENGNGILPVVYPVTAAAYRRDLCAPVKLLCYGIDVSQPVGRDPDLFRESFLAGLREDFMRMHHTSVISVIAAVMIVNVITCIDIVILLAGLSCYRN
jgi:hypothetical protein